MKDSSLRAGKVGSTILPAFSKKLISPNALSIANGAHNYMPMMKMTDHEFMKFSNFIYTNFGINMTLPKKVMLESRLQKRLHLLALNSYQKYFDLIVSDAGETELMHMIDVVSTNKTDFFREAGHFNFMADYILPSFKGAGRAMRIWSAGCSSGEEPYTVAMVIAEFVHKNGPLDYLITATDISTTVLRKGAEAIYGLERIVGIPLEYKMKYFLKSKDLQNPTVRIVPELRRKVVFHRLNFMDEAYSQVTGTFDVIFCRNAIIYFDRKTQEQVINKLCRKLNKGGILFLGHSESITDFNVPLEQIKPTVFRKL
jgi:chemotaxis protein methyltransferase CheR